jgi:hypothetical protein
MSDFIFKSDKCYILLTTLKVKGIKMAKSLTKIVTCLLFCFVISFPVVLCAESISKPTVSLPEDWYQDSETPYPQAVSQYDPAGSGMLSYTDGVDYDFVTLNYESAPTYTLSDTDLQTKSGLLFTEYHEEIEVTEVGTMTIGGSIAGYTRGYDPDFDVNYAEIVWVKNEVFLRAFVYYDATPQDWTQVQSLLDSISISESSGSITWIIIALVAVTIAVIVIVVIFLLLKRRKKPKEPEPVEPAPKPTRKSRFCMQCGNRLPNTGSFCNSCGSSARNFGGPGTKTCHCGTVIPSSAKFCSACGAKQSPS